ncbi:MAG TPA: hypothetical protein PKK74_08370 [Candidatus Methanoculleus thermohydrogenotrophicum]|jgi:hypothetical protein|nr:hypothetical protein [Candidatus Methanoculleus thermohydrogenotrophicum]HOB18689.1 hypothetical protein [Candidatus Methanoculleus thermohydrogenotrophicum]HPZ38759.1 hypothetical protein [Candidatus Methanoculleus thermohydrogenotrophicum]HQC91931.1 hypothetical protein [Candidatus Methanoculleus thermohydrogenotrophicum]
MFQLGRYTDLMTPKRDVDGLIEALPRTAGAATPVPAGSVRRK